MSRDDDGDGRAAGQGASGRGDGGDTVPMRTVIADMVHDLRNPLSALAGNLALLREELAGVALSRVGQQSFDDAVALAERALAMVTTIADIDALEAGRILARPRPTQLRGVIETGIVF